MKSKNNKNSNILDDEDDSDKELQLACEKGLLKPGLIEEVVKFTKGPSVNNKNELLKMLQALKLQLHFDERLDLTCKPAAIAPELALQLEEHKAKQMNPNVQKEDDLIYDDFAREMLIYRLAQSAVLDALPKLVRLGIPTKRPDDYLAEMVKTDDHMHKVRRKLKEKENRIVFTEKARKLRELKKFGKKVQVQRQLEKQAEKRKILDQLKKFKKGKTSSLDFLDEKPDKVDAHGIVKSKSQLKKELNELNNSRKNRDKKFGLNGNKKGWKRNTAKDLDGPLDSAGRRVARAPRGKPQKRHKPKPAQRPGKGSRLEQKNKFGGGNQKGNKGMGKPKGNKNK